MKQLVVVVSFMFTFSVSYAMPCVVTGTIGSKGTVYLLPYCYRYDVTIFPYIPTDSVVTNQDGRFKFVLNVPPNSIRAVLFGTEKRFICLAPGDSIVLNYDNEMRYFTLDYDKNGWNKQYQLPEFWKSVAQLRARLDSVSMTMQEFSTACAKLPPIPLFDAGHSLLRDIIHTDSIVQIHSIIKRSFHRLSDADSALLKPDSQELWNSIPDVALLLTSLPDYLYSEVWRGIKIRFPDSEKNDTISIIEKQFQVAKTYTGITRDIALFQVLFYCMCSDASDKAMNIYEKELHEFQGNFTDPNILTAFNSRLITYRKLSGARAPEITLEDKTGKIRSLSDYEDKVVCLEFTATWCGSCRELIPAFKELHKRLEKVKDIVFMRIWLEGPQYHDKWLKFMTGNTMHGIDLIALGGFIAPTALEYQVNGIPKIAVINRGKIETLTAPYPQKGNDDLEKLLLSLVKNKAIQR